MRCKIFRFPSSDRIYWRAPQQMLWTHRSLEGLLCKPVMKMRFFLLFQFNAAPVEWNWQGKTEVLGEKHVPVPLCPPQILHGLARDRNPASAVRDRGLTAWAMVRPYFFFCLNYLPCKSRVFVAMLCWGGQLALHIEQLLCENSKPYGSVPFLRCGL
jgi:hypothetical protein